MYKGLLLIQKKAALFFLFLRSLWQILNKIYFGNPSDRCLRLEKNYFFLLSLRRKSSILKHSEVSFLPEVLKVIKESLIVFIISLPETSKKWRLSLLNQEKMKLWNLFQLAGLVEHHNLSEFVVFIEPYTNTRK
jgi:hypothetical protein